MTEYLYEYAIIRYVPRVEREEFLNVGLIMVCKRPAWIQARIKVDSARLQQMPHAHTAQEIENQLGTFTNIAAGNLTAGPLAQLPPEERFRWLTAVKSSCLQTSRPHPGLATDLPAEFDRLFAEYIP